mgnify:CR=1 FL=1
MNIFLLDRAIERCARAGRGDPRLPGGFASIRSRLQQPLRKLREVRICCSGDGLRDQPGPFALTVHAIELVAEDCPDEQ